MLTKLNPFFWKTKTLQFQRERIIRFRLLEYQKISDSQKAYSDGKRLIFNKDTPFFLV